MWGITPEVVDEMRANLKRQADHSERIAVALERIADATVIEAGPRPDPMQEQIPGI